MTITIKRLPGYGDPITLDVETLVGADLSGADLRGAELCWAVLTGADLTRAVLSGAVLTGADLTRAVLTGADLPLAVLTGANLSDSDLAGANMYVANLIGANLIEADLHGVDLTKASLRGAHLRGADFSGAKIHNDTLASIITRIGRSDGHEFIAFRLADGSVKIMAGCRWMTPDEYRDHVAATYPGTPKAAETLAIIDHIERMAGIREGEAS